MFLKHLRDNITNRFYNKKTNDLQNISNKTLFSFSDNDFEYIPPEIKNMVNLRILALRDNELVEIPQVLKNSV